MTNFTVIQDSDPTQLSLRFKSDTLKPTLRELAEKNGYKSLNQYIEEILTDHITLEQFGG